MSKIQMVDLKGQYAKIQSEIDRAIQEVLDSANFINGPAVKKFQTNLEKYLGVKHVIPCGNGTDALQIAMMALGLKSGDEVITTSFTFIATVEVISLLGLKPVLVDVDKDSFNIDPAAIRRAITPKTKAILPVHLFGQCADMDAIMEIAKEFDLKVIEDSCQAIGANFKSSNGNLSKVGTIGDIGCTSFFPSKNLGAYGDGGAIFTNDDNLAKQCRLISNHGRDESGYHDLIGVNSRLDSIQAAVLDVKLKYLDQYAEARNKAALYYDKTFANHSNLQIPLRVNHSSHVFNQYTLITRNLNREALQAFLKKNGIPVMVYYPILLHKLQTYQDPRYKDGDFTNTEILCKSVISLPMHTELDDVQLDHICSTILNFINND